MAFSLSDGLVFELMSDDTLINRATSPRSKKKIFFNLGFFLVSFEESSLKRCKFKISVEMVKLFGCTKQFSYIAVTYILLCKLIMVNITRHVF